jgi:TRAP-type C4-dicarboxylate transport system permease small subunit
LSEPSHRTSPASVDTRGARRPRLPVAFEEALAVGCMAVLVLLTLGNVVVRYFTDESFAPTEEVSVVLLVLMTMAGASAAAARDRHIRIEYFYENGPWARRRRLALFSAAATTLFFLVLAGLSGRVVWDEYHYEETSMALGVPRWWYTVWVPLLCLAIAARTAGLFRALRRGQGVPGADAEPHLDGGP